jgi:hypothetical protein
MHDLLTPNAKTLEAPSARKIARAGLVTILGFGIYGLTVGYWRSPLMGVYVGVKMPLLIALTLACNGLLNGLIGALLGSGLGFRQSLHALLSAFAISALILGSVAPVTFFLALNIPQVDSGQASTSHSAYLLAHTLLIGLAGLVGVARLGKLLESYSQSKTIARATLTAWIAGNAFLGMQFSWILRPFFGTPTLKVEFLRDHALRGSFYEAVWSALLRIFDPTALVWLLLGIAIFVPISFLLIKPNHQRPLP